MTAAVEAIAAKPPLLPLLEGAAPVMPGGTVKRSPVPQSSLLTPDFLARSHPLV